MRPETKRPYSFALLALSSMVLSSCGGGSIRFEYASEMIETMKSLPLSPDEQNVVLVKGEEILSASFRHIGGTFVLFDETEEFVYSGSEEEFLEQYEGCECSSLMALDVFCPDNESFFALASNALKDAKILTAKDFFPRPYPPSSR